MALGAIPCYRVPQFFPRHECRAGAVQTIGTNSQYDKRVGKRASLLPHPLYVGFCFQSPRAFHASSRWNCTGFQSGNENPAVKLGLAKDFGALDTHGQFRASLGAARAQHIASTDGTHFAAKAMHAQAVQAFGLIRSFHVTSPDRRPNAARTISKRQKKRAATFTTRAMRDYTRALLNYKINICGKMWGAISFAEQTMNLPPTRAPTGEFRWHQP